MQDKHTPAWPKSLKRTKTREFVWAALEAAAQPVTAHSLFESLNRQDDSIWLSTVYRTLEAFVLSDCVVKSMPTDSSQAVYELKRHLHRHYAVCLKCHALSPVDSCPLEHVITTVTPDDFHVEGHSLELYGLCSDCFRANQIKPEV
jgi:Fur family ferric uptake transcriptional regulator